MKRLILASGSPRRKDLLDKYGFTYSIIKSDYEENDILPLPEETAMARAEGKAKDVFNRLHDKENCVVLGADTIVVLDGKIIGKPKDKQDAINTLTRLSNKEHTVITGYSIIMSDKIITKFVSSLVRFNNLSNETIIEYVDTGLPLDKAGSYGIQDGYNLVKSIHGSVNNVIGLPIEIFANELQSLLK